jgi:membrane peptidoglycan carboxypeptidase
MRLSRLITKGFAWVASIALGATWRQLRRDLTTAHARYRASLKREIPQTLVLTLVAAEDRRFFQHGGVDFRSICRAVWKNVSVQSREGGSTIEQQLVRRLTGMRRRSIKRKIKEILLASLVDTVVPKADIPGVYLSVAYFGSRMNGLQEACVRLGVRLRTLTPRECAAIVARLKYPEPKTASSARGLQIARRTDYILENLTTQSGQRFAAQFRIKVPQDAPLSDS